ncbi:hypothetical protein FO519_007950 [Halicephalobus sp. NKZ332]|nr:hypothetical protein FO519_007950 [Halicephalobus sp. NKZ332]
MRAFVVVFIAVLIAVVFGQQVPQPNPVPNPVPAPEAGAQFHQYPSNNYNYNSQYGTTQRPNGNNMYSTTGYYGPDGRFYNSASSTGLSVAALLSVAAAYALAH